MKTQTFILALVLVPTLAAAQAVTLDTSELRPGPVSVTSADNAVTVAWTDEASKAWRATFSLDPSRPLITSIASGASPVVTDARPFYRGETGKRRGGWNAFFDDPTSHPEGTRHVQGAFTLRGAKARSVGDRVELVFDGMRMGSFEGALSYTFYPGSRLIHQEAVLTTNDPDVAYYYDAGLDMTAPGDRTPGNNMRSEITYYDTSGTLKTVVSNGLQGRARAGPGPLSNAGGENRGRQRRRLSRSASIFLSAGLLVEPRVSMAPLVARPGGHRRAAVAGRELAVLPVGERASRTCAAHGSVLPRVGRHARGRALARAALYEPRSIPGTRGIQDVEHALAPRRHRAGDGERAQVDAAVQARAESHGRRRLDDHGLSRRRSSGRSHGPPPRRARRVFQGAQGPVGSRVPVDSRGRGERPPRRPLVGRVSQAGVLVHEPAQDRRMPRSR